MSGDRGLWALAALVLVVGLAAGRPSASAQQGVSLDGYAEWRRDGDLIVDGQRVRATPKTKWRGEHTDILDIPLGDEVRVRGQRQADGLVLASQIDVRPNMPNALFEADVRQGTEALESAWTTKGLAFEPTANGAVKRLGEVQSDGAQVERLRRLVTRLAPPYVRRNDLRVYVIDNEEWNAMAMGNGAIWVYSGLMRDMTDDQLAIVVGHELAHYTHEHSRRQARRGVWTQLAGLAAMIGAQAISHDAARVGARLGASLGLSALTAGYGRDLEDQADRVGLRYAHEAGFAVEGAPEVWQEFLDKYGQQDHVTNFFFSDHSRSSARKRNLEREIAHNYGRREAADGADGRR